MPTEAKKPRVKISKKSIGKVVDTAPVTFSESSIIETHWQAMVHASGKAEAVLMAAMARGAKPGGGG